MFFSGCYPSYPTRQALASLRHTQRGCSSSEFGAGCRSYTIRARQCLVFVTCCSLIWLRAQDGAESQIQISGQTWILCFSYQTSSWFGKVVLSPAHAMRRTPVICWKRGCSCCEKLPAGKPGFESLLWLTLAAAGGLGATGTRSDSSAEEEKEWCKENCQEQSAALCLFLVPQSSEPFYFWHWDSDALQQQESKAGELRTKPPCTKACF